MKMTVTLDKAGRVLIPKSLRDALRLEPGDTLELASKGEDVTLSPVRSASPLRKERGVWVFHGGTKLTADEATRAAEAIRGRRDRDNLETK